MIITSQKKEQFHVLRITFVHRSLNHLVGMFAAAMLWCGPAQAVDYSLTGFGTVQYTQGDNQENYLRFANEDGTLKVNSIIGAQLDVNISPEFSATFQYVIAPKQDNDQGVEIDNRWSFIRWKPNDNWSFKVGRQRLNLYLDSENLDVGQTYVPANLSPEIYYNAAVLGVDGVSATYNFEDNAGRYWGVQTIVGERDIIQRLSKTTQDFPTSKYEILGLVINLDGERYRVQLAHHEAWLSREIFQFNGRRVVDGSLNAKGQFTNLGAEYNWDRYSLRGELSQLEFSGTTKGVIPVFGPQQQRSDIAQFPEHGGNLTLIRKLNNDHAVYTSLGRFISDFDDQYSIAIGGKYALSASDSIKAELMHVVEKNTRPQLSDNRINNTTFNMLSVSYNWVWQ